MSLGNDLKNSQTIQLTASANMSTIYNKIPFIKDLQQKNQGKGKGKQQQQPQKKEMKTVTFEKTYFSLKAGVPKNISHKLGCEDVKVKVTDTKNNEIKGKVDIVSNNRLTFTPDSDATNATVVVEGKVEAGPNPFLTAKPFTVTISAETPATKAGPDAYTVQGGAGVYIKVAGGGATATIKSHSDAPANPAETQIVAYVCARTRLRTSRIGRHHRDLNRIQRIPASLLPTPGNRRAAQVLPQSFLPKQAE